MTPLSRVVFFILRTAASMIFALLLAAGAVWILEAIYPAARTISLREFAMKLWDMTNLPLSSFVGCAVLARSYFKMMHALDDDSADDPREAEPTATGAMRRPAGAPSAREAQP